jgi:predicted unusual protein kinase regulating ubiquinone biosynthesis (AarF/ABC1/UbiB family)
MIERKLPIELDFCNEGRNAEKAAKHMRAAGMACVVPKVLWEHSSSRVLVMEFEEGFKATDLKAMEKSGLKRR